MTVGKNFTVVHHSSTFTHIPSVIKIRRKSVDGRADIEHGFITSGVDVNIHLCGNDVISELEHIGGMNREP